ncbi:hypothetical protein ACH36K_15370 [Clostridium sp. MB05]|uniref:hypothetical protein n=1 Tax=Clostridium sp. MB05 TaxID=3376682 RepID=UPI0039822C6D
MKKIIEYKYMYLKNDYFAHRRDTRERNDIVYVRYTDGTEVCRIYLNNVEEYVEIIYDSVMVSYISKITWTKDTTTDKGGFIKSDADKVCLNNVLRRYKKIEKYKVKKLSEESIDKHEKWEKRKELIKNNPEANTDKAA